MRRVRRHIEIAIHAGRLECLRISFGIAAEATTAASAIPAKFPASVADEHPFHLLLERSHLGYIRGGDTAAAENPDVRELVEIG